MKDLQVTRGVTCGCVVRFVPACFVQAVLADSKVCPFTKTPMTWEQCTVLTHSNIDRYRDRIKSM